MFIFLLFAAAFADKAFIKRYNLLDEHRYIKIREGDCNYVRESGEDWWFIVDYVNNKPMVTVYEKEKCSGASLSNKMTDLIFNSYIGEYKDEPFHLAFENVPDKEGCPNEKYAIRKFIEDICIYQKNGPSAKYIKKDDKIYHETYSDSNCQTKLTSVEKFKCDTCSKQAIGTEYVKYQCGSVATMILAIFLVVAFLF